MGGDTANGIANRLPSTSGPFKGDLVFFASGGSTVHVELVTGDGSATTGASGGDQNTHGDDPNAKVQPRDWAVDGRPHTFRTIEDLL